MTEITRGIYVCSSCHDVLYVTSSESEYICARCERGQPPLNWEFSHSIWGAERDGRALEIAVCDDGTYTIQESDPAFWSGTAARHRYRTYDSIDAAKSAAQDLADGLRLCRDCGDPSLAECEYCAPCGHAKVGE